MKQRENAPPDEVAMVVGQYVIRAEHEHFVADSLDNWEHIPRISRVVRAVSTGLSELHVPADDVTRVSAGLVGYAKELFMAEWMSDVQDDEDPRSVHAEGIAEFDRIFTR